MIRHRKQKHKRQPRRYNYIFPIGIFFLFLLTFFVLKQADLSPKSGFDLYFEARTLQAQGRYHDSIEMYTQAIETEIYWSEMFYTDRAMSYRSIGENALAEADFALALTYINRQIELYPENADYYNSRGYLYLMMGDYDLAVKDLNYTIELNPYYAYAYNNRGRAYFLQGDVEQALKDHNHSQSLDPDNDFVYKWRGDLYFEIGEYELALADYERHDEIVGGMHQWMREQVFIMEEALAEEATVRKIGISF